MEAKLKDEALSRLGGDQVMACLVQALERQFRGY